MKIAVVGSAGYIAGFLIERLKNENRFNSILKIDQTNDADAFLDLLNADNFDYSILEEIDFVIFTAAVSSPDKCASEYKLCKSINVDGTSLFIRKAIEKNCKVLFLSSDAVFGDIPGYIYDENSETNPNTAYGKMKKSVEDEFKNDNNFKAVRLSYVVSAKDRFTAYCLNCIKENKTADVFHPFYRNCVTVSDVVNAVLWLTQQWDEYEPFVLNIAGKELVSRVRIADELNRIFDGKLKYKISIPNDSFFNNRPKITQMKSLYLKKNNILKDITFTEKIQSEMEKVKL